MCERDGACATEEDDRHSEASVRSVVACAVTVGGWVGRVASGLASLARPPTYIMYSRRPRQKFAMSTGPQLDHISASRRSVVSPSVSAARQETEDKLPYAKITYGSGQGLVSARFHTHNPPDLAPHPTAQ